MKKLRELWRGRSGHPEPGTGAGTGPETGPGAEESDPSDPDSPQERARRGRWRLVVAAALFATLVLPRVTSSASYTDPALAQPSPSGGPAATPS
ncbi:hypothetical protein G5C65_31270, partial [Streptomyces sp. SB3404]|nr:hypothetical protein [Streptomyces boncukensis]